MLRADQVRLEHLGETERVMQAEGVKTQWRLRSPAGASTASTNCEHRPRHAHKGRLASACLCGCSELGQPVSQVLRPLAEGPGFHTRLHRAPLQLRQLPLGRLQRRAGFYRVRAGLLKGLHSSESSISAQALPRTDITEVKLDSIQCYFWSGFGSGSEKTSSQPLDVQNRGIRT